MLIIRRLVGGLTWIVLSIGCVIAITCFIANAWPLETEFKQASGYQASDDETKARRVIPVNSEKAKLDLLTANVFHRKLEVLCQYVGMEVHYEGPLAWPMGRAGIDRDDVKERAFRWSVSYGERGKELRKVLFRIEVLTERRPDTIVTCKMGALTLHLSYIKSASGLGLDDKLPIEGAKETVKHLLKRLEES